MEETEIFEYQHGVSRVRCDEDFKEFVSYSFCRNVYEFRCMVFDCMCRVLFYRKPKACSEPYSPKHAKGILGEALIRITHGANEFFLDIFLTIIRVNQRLSIKRDCVNGEVPTCKILIDRLAPGNFIRVSVILIPLLTPIRRDFINIRHLCFARRSLGGGGFPDLYPDRSELIIVKTVGA